MNNFINIEQKCNNGIKSEWNHISVLKSNEAKGWTRQNLLTKRTNISWKFFLIYVQKFSHPVRTSINKIKNRKSTSSTKTNSISEENIKHKCTPKHKLNENITSGDFSTNKQTEDSKVDTGAASDESWEKDFDLSDH